MIRAAYRRIMAEDLVKVWVPYWEGGLHTSLAVPFNGGQMTRAIYGDLLVWHMENLIKADPLAAKRLFEVMGQGAFSEVCTASPPEAWAIQVMLCDSANIVLKEIDYERGGLDMVPREDIENLWQLLEQLRYSEWD
jgi:hypothetical protein